MRNVRAWAPLLALVMTSWVSTAEAHPTHFLGGHPVAAKYGGGYCLIEAPHMHVYPPDHPNLYQRVGDQVVFTADPTPFGYEGDKHPFYGNHPVVTVDGEPVICYLDGPHFHPFAAPDVPDYEMKKGVAFYVGAMPPSYAKLRPARARAINVEYQPFVAQRPVIEVTPPERWHGDVWVAPPQIEVRGPAVDVRGPAVDVRGPAVDVRGPSVVVSAPGIIVAPPQPPRVYIGGPSVEVEGGVYVDDRRGGHGKREHGREHEHHDNGRHNGWFKH